ncbi:MAG TPA: VCBS repeat-containing protein, partial [Kofleriaceae bacterium]
MKSHVLVYGLLAACHSGSHEACNPACGDGLVCRYATCVVPIPCTANTDCAGDQYCETAAGECLPWGVGPGGTSDRSCAGTPAPGAFFPAVQCAWSGPPQGDPFPGHVNVLATPMVATLDDPITPSIVFPSYNGTDDHTLASCSGDPKFYGVLRVIDGRTCAQRATLSQVHVVASASVAVGDLGGDDATPEIVAATSAGGLVAYTHRAEGWDLLWQTTSNIAAAQCDWAGPSIHDLDGDGVPEVIFYGAVYDGQTGKAIDESLGTAVDSIGGGYIPVVADVDGDGAPELVTGKHLYSWDKGNRKWTPRKVLPAGDGLVAVGDFGTFPAVGQDDRSHTDGIAEVAVVFSGTLHVFNVAGREVFKASFRVGSGFPQGGPLVIADFDGDGRAEIGSAGFAGYHVFDPDCRPLPGLSTPDPATCATLSTDGVLWTSATQNRQGDLPGSSAFDFDGDGRPEIVSHDQCFTRIYDGTTGKVLSSRPRTSCQWYENPIVADTDGDFNAELITTSNASCGVSCPAVDPMFDGAQCVDNSDCPVTTLCGRDQAGDALGRCRCAADTDCGDGFVCRDPRAGPSAAGKVCRAAHAAGPMTGVQVLADTADRWIGARPIWNQHAYSITNVGADGVVPRTGQWLLNWTQSGLNSFRV